MKGILWKFFTAMVVIALILSGCKVTERSYRRVATDTNVTSEKKAIIAPWVSIYFPIQETVIPGKTVTKIDTLTTTKTDTILGVVHHYDTVHVTRTVNKTDTVKIEDYAKLLTCRREAVQKDADLIIQTSIRRQAEADKAKVEAKFRNLWLIIIALSIALLLSIYFHIRKMFL